MKITDYSLHNRSLMVVVCVIITFSGMWAYVTMPREAAPDVEFPYIMVITAYEGASPSDIESLITYPLERKLKSLTDVKKMKSTSSEGSSSIFIEFEPNVEIDTALQRVRDKVDEAKSDLPEDLEADPIVKELSPNEMWPVLLINISGDIGLARLKDIAEDMEEDAENIPGVLDAEILGGLEREIRVEFDPDRVAAYGLTISEIIQTISLNNVNTPGGSLDVGEAKYAFKTPTEFQSPDEIFHLVVAMRDNRPVYLSDIATIRDTFKDRVSFARVNGQEAVTVKVTKRTGEHMLRIADELKALTERYRQRYPPQVRFTITADSSKDIRMMVNDLENNVLTALLFVLIVVFIGMGWRNAIVVAMAIPFSMLIGFWVLDSLGFTLNMIVLFSLVLAVGMLVDNAIVIVENIYRHHVQEGRPLMEAASVGANEVAWPVIGSTATTVAAFVPLVFWPGIMGQFMGYLPKTIIIVLTASLLVAMTINPVLSSLLVRKPRRARPDAEGDDWAAHLHVVIRVYRRLLEFGLRYRALALGVFAGMLYLAIYAFAHSGLGVELFPDTEPRRIMVDIEAPQGTNVFKTNEFALKAEAIARKYGNVENITANVGLGSGGPDSGPNHARVMIDMIDRELRQDQGPGGLIYFRDSNRTMEALRAELIPAIVGAKVTVDKEKEGPPTGAPVNVEIAGDDYATLARLAQRLTRDIEAIPGLVDLKDDYNAGLPEINLRVDKEKAALLGLNSFLIGQIIKACVNGIKVGDYREAEDEYDITARLPERFRSSVDDIVRLRVPAPDGRQVPLSSVAEVRLASGLSAIRHIKAKRVVTISANVAKGFNSDLVLQRVRHIAQSGRSLFSREDILDPDGFVARMRRVESPAAKALWDGEYLTSATRALLARAEDGARPELMGALVHDLNRALEDAAFSAAVTGAQPPAALSGATLEQRVAANRAALSAAWPGVFSNPPAALSLPNGYFIKYTGENEERERSGSFMLKSFIIAIMLVALVIVAQFGRIVYMGIIMTSVILSFIGVFLGLIIARQPFGIIMTGMGVISLAGVVVNNAIVLLDYINQLRARGLNAYDAIIRAGCTRFRPVMLTAITTVLGLVPMALNFSIDFRRFQGWPTLAFRTDSAQWWGPMSVCVIFGLAIATLLTLFVVPNVYSLIFDWRLHRQTVAAPANLKAAPMAEPSQG